MNELKKKVEGGPSKHTKKFFFWTDYLLFYYICDCKLLEKKYESSLALILKRILELGFSFKVDIEKKVSENLKNARNKEWDQIYILNILKDHNLSIHYQFKFRF